MDEGSDTNYVIETKCKWRNRKVSESSMRWEKHVWELIDRAAEINKRPEKESAAQP